MEHIFTTTKSQNVIIYDQEEVYDNNSLEKIFWHEMKNEIHSGSQP